jgi:anaerobic carbon-monoxide dehydrogenase iron sulfur subunit
MRFVTGDPDYCVACRDCVYACAFAHGGSFERAASRITVSFSPEQRTCLPLTCLQCEEAWCLSVCPAAAITRDPRSGAVEIDQTRCAGCKLCLLACPLGAVHFDPDAGVARKCDLCGGDPACVRACTSGCLQYRDADEVPASRGQTLLSLLGVAGDRAGADS